MGCVISYEQKHAILQNSRKYNMKADIIGQIINKNHQYQIDIGPSQKIQSHETYENIAILPLNLNNVKQTDVKENNNDYIKKSDTINSKAQEQPVLEAILSAIDRRDKIQQKLKYPFNCIGKLCFATQYQQGEKNYSKSYNGTGFLIAPNIVLTSAHFIQIYKKIGVKAMNFLISQYSNDIFFQVFLHSRKIVHFAILNKYDSLNKAINQDYGIVFLDSDVHRQKYIQLASNFWQIDIEAHIYGYPIQTKKIFKLVGMKGQIKAINDNIIQYDIDTSVGQSGSPILVQYIDKNYVSIGIHLGKYDNDTYNSGCLINQQMVKNIHAWIDQYQNKNNDDTRQTSKSFLFKKGQFNQNYGNFSLIDLEKSSIRILDQLKILKKQNYSKTVKSSIMTKDQQSRQKYLEHGEQSYLEEKHHQSLVYCEQGLNSDDLYQVQKFKIFNLTGLNYFKLYQFELALYYYSESLELQAKLRVSDKNILIKTLNNIGSAYVALNQSLKAKKFFFKSRKLRKQIKFQNEQEQLQILMSDGLICLSQDNILKAYNLFKSAKALSFKQSNILTIEKAIIMNNLADATFKLRRIDEWLQFSFACMWILNKLGLSQESQYLNWYASFLKNVNNSMQKAQTSLLLKLGRIWRILELKQSDLHVLIIGKIKNILNGSEQVKIIQ